MAEREGFEPPIEFPLFRISSAALSTTQPSLRLHSSYNVLLAILQAKSKSVYRVLDSSLV